MDPRRNDLLTIGEVASRSGLAPSALRFYEDEGLITAERTPAGHRVFRRHVLRRIAFIRSAQRAGLSLGEVAGALASLPPERAPTKAQWAILSRAMRREVDARIVDLLQLRDTLTSCIGCGCLSLQACPLSNPDDAAAGRGEGARYWEGDDPDEVVLEHERAVRAGSGADQ